MSQLTVLHFPDPRLRNKAQPVAVVNSEIQQLVDDMLETMYADQGIGLAAIQVGVSWRVIVMDIPKEHYAGKYEVEFPLALINAEIIEHRGTVISQEGCLSVPGEYVEVKRHEWVKVRFLNREGQEQTLEADELLAFCIQHEIDHLNGILVIDYLSKLKQQRILKRLEKQQRISM